MKKWLILMLVLGLTVGLTSPASGVLVTLAPGTSPLVDGSVTWTVVGGNIVAISDTNGITYDAQIGPLDNGTIVADPTYVNYNSVAGLSDDAGDAGYVAPNATFIGYYDVGGNDALVDKPDQEPGQWFQFNVTTYAVSSGQDSMQLDVYTGPGWGLTGSINVIPEPMTIALLGLGGLLLRRRKGGRK